MQLNVFHDTLYPRIVAEIQKQVTKQNRRSPISRFIRPNGDKEEIAAWRSELSRILQIFNVRRPARLLAFLTVRP